MRGSMLWVYLLCTVAIHTVKSQDPPTWDKQYAINATLELPYAEIKEPITAYYDELKNQSRIDYYIDIVGTIQLGPSTGRNKTGAYKIAYMTDDKQDILNQRTCFGMDGTPLDPVGIQSIFPDTTGFQLVKKDAAVNGHTCQIWQMTNKIGNKKNTYTLWVTQVEFTTAFVPLRYEMIGYDTLLGSHYDKYYIDYDVDNYKRGPDSVSAEGLFDPEKAYPGVTKCGSFPGPGDSTRGIRINPMMEFINNFDDHIDEMFNDFKITHKKEYKDFNEHTTRQHIFRQNVRFIHSHNRAKKSFTVALNHLADLTFEELKVMRGYRHSYGYNGGQPFHYSKSDLKNIPDNVDWRLYGAVTQVKDQAVCGSCWSFGTTGAVEGALFMKTGELVRLSQQALVDCSWGEGNNGCDGGEDFRAYEWIKRNGLPSEESYGAYIAKDGKCHNENATIGTGMSGFVNVTSGDVQALRVALAKNGPISVAIDASHKSLSFYSNGIYYEPECGNTPDSLDHAVLAVGYGTLNGQDFWLVKNSWSTYWGNDGYVLMAQKDNNCGVATSPTYVLI